MEAVGGAHGCPFQVSQRTETAPALTITPPASTSGVTPNRGNPQPRRQWSAVCNAFPITNTMLHKSSPGYRYLDIYSLLLNQWIRYANASSTDLALSPNRLSNPVAPDPLRLAHQCWVNNPISEGLDESHVSLPEGTAWLDVDGHLPLVASFALIYPGQVHHAVHGPV